MEACTRFRGDQGWGLSEKRIGHPVAKRSVETSGTAPRIVARHQKHGFALGVEDEPPLPVGRAKPHALHVRVPRALQCVQPGSSQLGPELLQQAGHGQDRVLSILLQTLELRRELLGDLDRPVYETDMYFRTYAVKNIISCLCDVLAE